MLEGGGELEFKVIGLVHYLLAWMRPIVGGGGELEFKVIGLVHYLLAWMRPIVGGGGELEFKVIGLVHYLLAWMRPIVGGGRGAGIQGHRSCSLPSSVDEAIVGGSWNSNGSCHPSTICNL